jgi:predicted nucleic acid-binding protein
MKDSVFIDTNILVYAISTDTFKAEKIGHLFKKQFNFVISTQVISEFINTCHKKALMPKDEIRYAVEDFLSFFELAIIETQTLSLAFDLKAKYDFSWYDALIVAAALQQNCTTLFSEDMQHGLVVNQRLTISNPFV